MMRSRLCQSTYEVKHAKKKKFSTLFNFMFRYFTRAGTRKKKVIKNVWFISRLLRRIIYEKEAG